MKQTMKCIATALAVLMLWCVPALAEKTEVSAEGKYIMGDLDTKLNARALALMEAKRIALEKAGTYMESISEVRNFELTKDQVISLTAGIMSVETLKEEWKMAGENMVLTLSIRATVDTSNLNSRIAAMREYQDTESNKEMKAQIESLKKELAELKVQRETVKDKTAPQQEMITKNENIIKKMTTLDALKEGRAVLQVGNYKEAIVAFRRVLNIDPNLAEAYAGMSIAFQLTQEPEKAVEMVNMALKLDPKSPIGHYAMSRIMYDDGKYDQALESINVAIQLYPNNPFYFLLRGEIYMKLRNGKLALKDYQQACNMNSYTACQRVDMLRQRMADKKSDEDLYRAPGLMDRQPKTAEEYMEAGHTAARAHSFKEAIDAYRRALDIDPNLVGACAGLSIVYSVTKEQAKAIEMANTALKISQHHPSGHHAMSRIMYDDGKYDKALEHINVAIRLYYRYPYYYIDRANIYMKLQNSKAALKDYERACDMNLSWGCQRAKVVKQQMAEAKK